MFDESTNPGEKPVNDGGGGGNPPQQPDPEPDGEVSLAGTEKPVNQGGGGTE